MPENAIIAEIHRHRETGARDCGYDAAKLMDYYRRREVERGDDGHPLSSFVKAELDSPVLREEPPKR